MSPKKYQDVTRRDKKKEPKIQRATAPNENALPESKRETNDSNKANQPTAKPSDWKAVPIDRKIEIRLSYMIVIFTGFIVLISQWQRCDFNRASERELRAFVQVLEPQFLQDTTFADTTTGFPLLKVKFQLKNVGQTTAYDVRDSIGFVIIDTSKVTNLPNPRFWEVKGVPKVLGSGVQVQLFGSTTDGPKSLAYYNSHRDRIIFFGIVRYKDIYGEERWTTFRYFYVHLHGLVFTDDRFNEADTDYD